MAIAFTSTAQTENTGGIKILLYGNSGEGKTSLAATCPAPIIASAESGLLSLRKANIERMYGVNTVGITYDIPVMPIVKIEDIEEIYQWCLANAYEAGFRTIYIDSITEIAEVVLAAAKKSNTNMLQAYGKTNDLMVDIIKKFRDLPRMNVIMTAKMGAIKDDASGIVKLGPMMPGQTVGVGMPYWFDEVFRLATARDEKGVPYRFLQTIPDERYHAKDRSGALASPEFPNFTYVIEKILAA